jgi:hypothetical protein
MSINEAMMSIAATVRFKPLYDLQGLRLHS